MERWDLSIGNGIVKEEIDIDTCPACCFQKCDRSLVECPFMRITLILVGVLAGAVDRLRESVFRLFVFVFFLRGHPLRLRENPDNCSVSTRSDHGLLLNALFHLLKYLLPIKADFTCRLRAF